MVVIDEWVDKGQTAVLLVSDAIIAVADILQDPWWTGASLLILTMLWVRCRRDTNASNCSSGPCLGYPHVCINKVSSSAREFQAVAQELNFTTTEKIVNTETNLFCCHNH